MVKYTEVFTVDGETITRTHDALVTQVTPTDTKDDEGNVTSSRPLVTLVFVDVDGNRDTYGASLVRRRDVPYSDDGTGWSGDDPPDPLAPPTEDSDDTLSGTVGEDGTIASVQIGPPTNGGS